MSLKLDHLLLGRAQTVLSKEFDQSRANEIIFRGIAHAGQTAGRHGWDLAELVSIDAGRTLKLERFANPNDVCVMTFAFAGDLLPGRAPLEFIVFISQHSSDHSLSVRAETSKKQPEDVFEEMRAPGC